MSVSSIAKNTATAIAISAMVGASLIGFAEDASASTHYNVSQLEGIWINAGGNPAKACTAAAVAMAESGGNPNAYSPTHDRGLWQINAVHGSLSTFDVYGNARAAIKISGNGSHWGAWTTYTQGTYGTYLKDCSGHPSAPVNNPAPVDKTPSSKTTPKSSQPTVTHSQKPSAPVVPVAASGNSYKVVSGDCLSVIGEKYGVAWESIYNLNKDKINDPDLIFPDQVFAIPAK